MGATTTTSLGVASSAFAALLTLGLYTNIYRRTLVPIYASGPTELYLKEFLVLSVFLGSSRVFPLSKSVNFLLASIIFACAPLGTYWVAVHTARYHDSILGPSITHLCTLVPPSTVLFSLILTPAKRSLVVVQSLVLSLVTYFIVPWLETQWHPIVSLVPRPDGSIVRVVFASSKSSTIIEGWDQLHALAVVAYFLSWLTHQTPLAPPIKRTKQKKAIKPTPSTVWPTPVWASVFLLALPLHGPLSSPILSHPLVGPYFHPDAPLIVHSAVESVTGLIIVAEIKRTSSEQGLDDNMHSVRFMRADHSLLGGLWTGVKVITMEGEDPVKDASGEPLGDSIYATFNLQEAVLLAKQHKFQTSLMIGLGTGISASAFMRHGVSTTIVEIDPAVYNAARSYFGLPDPGPSNVFLEDAREWLTKRRAEPAELFDFVVHDCFSGGGVPQHIFTLEFWMELKSVMTPDGILVLNTAGILRSDSSRLIYHTLIRAFKQCRGFHDQFEDLRPEQYEKDFVNVVWFCTSSDIPLEFRPAALSDFLGSPLRQHILSGLDQREIPTSLLESTSEQDSQFILTDAHNPLGKLQEAQGGHHWEVMREVLDDVYWEIF